MFLLSLQSFVVLSTCRWNLKLLLRKKYFQAFQLLPEYLQILENSSGLSVVQGMRRGIEAWLARTLQKLDTHLLGVCQMFDEENYLTVVDAYALMGMMSVAWLKRCRVSSYRKYSLKHTMSRKKCWETYYSCFISMLRVVLLFIGLSMSTI